MRTIKFEDVSVSFKNVGRRGGTTAVVEEDSSAIKKNDNRARIRTNEEAM